MDAFARITALSIAMGCGSFGAGYVPLLCNFSRQKLNYITTFGVGVLIGTAFIVIIPEGIHIVYKQPALTEAIGHTHDIHNHDSHGSHLATTGAPVQTVSHCHPPSATEYIGFAIALGFIFMLIMDKIFASHGHAHSHSPDGADPHQHSPRNSSNPQSQQTSVMTGILIHAAVDGLALGAISSSHNEALEFVVFAAIMLHKAPAAFGLSSFFLQQGLTNRQVTKNLAIFSSCAPLAAMITAIGGHSHSYFVPSEPGTTPEQGDNAFMGLLLLFSGGTFLYTIVEHVLPASQSHSAAKEPALSSESGLGAGSTSGELEAGGKGKPSDWVSLGLLVAGVLSPMLIRMDHQH